MTDRDEAIHALNAALTHSGSGALRERALHDAAVLARRVLLDTQDPVPEVCTSEGETK